jgi:hypothetical protein
MLHRPYAMNLYGYKKIAPGLLGAAAAGKPFLAIGALKDQKPHVCLKCF